MTSGLLHAFEAFALVLQGKVLTWGWPTCGGDSSSFFAGETGFWRHKENPGDGGNIYASTKPKGKWLLAMAMVKAQMVKDYPSLYIYFISYFYYVNQSLLLQSGQLMIVLAIIPETFRITQSMFVNVSVSSRARQLRQSATPATRRTRCARRQLVSTE